MHVSFSNCRKTAKCRYCPNPIETGQPMVVGRSRKESAGGKYYYFTSRWHPQCYLDQGLQYLDKHPYTPATKGRPVLNLTSGQRTHRLSLLRIRATSVQRVRAELQKLLPNYNIIQHHGTKLQELYKEIEHYGGAPKSWQQPTVESTESAQSTEPPAIQLTESQSQPATDEGSETTNQVTDGV